MKKLIITLTLMCFNLITVWAQTNNALTVFTESGERFFLIINGIKQNNTAETNVKVTGLNGMQVKAKIIFEQVGIPDCDKSIPMMWEAEQVSNTEFVYSVSKDKKGSYKWKFVSKSPVGTTPVVATNTVSAQNNSTNVNANTNVQSSGNGVANTNVTTTTSTTTTTAGNTGVNMNLGINGVGMNVSMNVNDGTGGNVNSTTTTTTTSYTTSTVTTASGTTNNVNTNSNTNNTNISNTNGGNCGLPMSVSDYNDAQNSIKETSFEDTKLSTAKQIADVNCLDVAQIKGIMKLFSFEDSKLEFAKYCYATCYDKKNYFKLNDAFTFDSSKKEMNEYIKDH